MGAHTRIVPPHRRKLVEAEIDLHLQRVTFLIARLDRTDGDCDLEDDDPAGDTLDEHGEHDEARGLAPPIYAIDQSQGPLNYAYASNERQAREMGLVRSPGGAWRRI